MDGMRSVLVEFCMDRNEYSYCYHFLKVCAYFEVIDLEMCPNSLLLQIRLIILVCNHKKHVEGACNLILHLSSSQSRISLWLLLNFEGCPSSPLSRTYQQMMCLCGGSLPSLMNAGWTKMFSTP